MDLRMLAGCSTQLRALACRLDNLPMGVLAAAATGFVLEIRCKAAPCGARARQTTRGAKCPLPVSVIVLLSFFVSLCLSHLIVQGFEEG